MKNGPRKVEKRVLTERTERKVRQDSRFNPVCLQRRGASTFSCGIRNPRELLKKQAEAGDLKTIGADPRRKKLRAVVLRSPFMDQEFDLSEFPKL